MPSIYLTTTLSFDLTIPHINSETDSLPELSMLLASISDSFVVQVSVLLLFQYATTLSRGWTWFIFAKCTIPEFLHIFPRTDLVLIVYVRYCRFRMFIINGYYTKSKRLQSLDSLFTIFLSSFSLFIYLCDIQNQRKFGY